MKEVKTIIQRINRIIIPCILRIHKFKLYSMVYSMSKSISETFFYISGHITVGKGRKRMRTLGFEFTALESIQLR